MGNHGAVRPRHPAFSGITSVLRSIRFWCITFAVVAALLGLTGAAIGSVALAAVSPNWPAMTPNAAIGILVLSLATAWIREDRPRRRIATLLVAVPAIIGAGTLLQYAMAVDIGLDRLFLRTRLLHPALSGRPAPETAACLLLSSGSLWLLVVGRRPRFSASQLLAALVLSVSILALTGYLSGLETLYSLFVQQKHVGMALPTAAALLSTSIAILLSYPTRGFIKLIASPTLGGTVARRLVTATLITPPAIGVVGLWGVGSGLFNEGLRLALAPLLGSGVLLVLTWFTARRLDVADQERLASERELATSESRLRAILEVVPVGLWWTDPEGKITQGNTMGHQIWAGTHYVGPREFGRYKAWWVDSGKQLTAEEWALTRAIRKGEVSVGEQLEIECFDGSHKYVLNSAAPFKDTAGRIIGAVAVNLDITDRVRLERRLRLLADSGRALLDPIEYEGTFVRIAQVSVPAFADWCTIHVIGESGGLERVASAYRASSLKALAEHAFGAHSPNSGTAGGVHQVLRTGLPIFVPEVDETILEQLIRDAGLRDEFRALVRSYILVPLILKGSTVGVLSFARGESGRVFEGQDVEVAQNLAVLVSLAAENAKLIQESRRAARSREEMVAIVSHDLRNPISAIRLAALAMKGFLSGKIKLDNERLRKLAEAVLASSDSMNRLVKDLLDLSRMEAGKFVVSKEQQDIADLLAQLETVYALLANAKRVELKIQRPEEPAFVGIDQDRMMQVLSNLLGNALKFTPAGGRIELRTSQSDTELIIEVADSGPGIPARDLPHLFERYWQPARSRKKGAGLGLFISKGIVEAHGGRIWVESAEGRGSRFFVAIPLPSRAPRALSMA